MKNEESGWTSAGPSVPEEVLKHPRKLLRNMANNISIREFVIEQINIVVMHFLQQHRMFQSLDLIITIKGCILMITFCDCFTIIFAITSWNISGFSPHFAVRLTNA